MKSYKAPTKNLRYKTQKEKDTKERGRVVWMFQWDCKPAQCWHWDDMILETHAVVRVPQVWSFITFYKLINFYENDPSGQEFRNAPSFLFQLAP